MSYTNPGLRESIKKRVLAGSSGGRPGQWSARKAQLVAQQYKKAGGGYTGSKSSKQKSLSKWTKEEWGTRSGKPSTQGSKATGERYLPKKARQALSKKEYALLLLRSVVIPSLVDSSPSNLNQLLERQRGIDNGSRKYRFPV